MLSSFGVRSGPASPRLLRFHHYRQPLDCFQSQLTLLWPQVEAENVFVRPYLTPSSVCTDNTRHTDNTHILCTGWLHTCALKCRCPPCWVYPYSTPAQHIAADCTNSWSWVMAASYNLSSATTATGGSGPFILCCQFVSCTFCLFHLYYWQRTTH